MDSIEILGEAIRDYPGALVMVTHDENLLHKLVNKLIVFRKSGAEVFLGTYQDFLNKIGWDEEEQVSKKESSKKQLTKKEKTQIKQDKVKALSPLRKKIQSCEDTIEELEKTIEICNSLLIAASDSGDSDSIIENDKKIKESHQQIEDLFIDLEALSDELQTKEEAFDLLLG